MPELVVHGVRGFVGGTDEDLARFVRDVRGIDRVACRRPAEERYSVERMVADYEALYRSLLER